MTTHEMKRIRTELAEKLMALVRTDKVDDVKALLAKHRDSGLAAELATSWRLDGISLMDLAESPAMEGELLRYGAAPKLRRVQSVKSRKDISAMHRAIMEMPGHAQTSF